MKQGRAPVVTALKIEALKIEALKAGRRRLVRGLWRLLTAVLGPFKDALLDIRVNSGLLFSLVGKICWVIPLVAFDRVFSTFPGFYHDFRQTGPEWAWALVFLGLVLCDCGAIIRRAYEWQIVCLGLGAMLWLTLCRLVASGVPHGTLGLPSAPTAFMYFFAGIGCIVSAYRLIHQHGARQEAMQFLLVSKRVEAERAAGEKWAQEKEKWAQEKVVPEKVVPEKVVPEKVVPEKVVPEKVVPEKVVPDQWVLEQR